MLNILSLTYHILHVCNFYPHGYIIICFMMDILFMLLILHLMQIHPPPKPSTFWVCEWLMHTKPKFIIHHNTKCPIGMKLYVIMNVCEGFLDVCYLFIKMVQDNTCSHTIGMNSHHIFMPIRIHPGWWIIWDMLTHSVPSYKMLKCTHVDMMFEFIFRIFGILSVMSQML